MQGDVLGRGDWEGLSGDESKMACSVGLENACYMACGEWSRGKTRRQRFKSIPVRC
jgi:hypothetical protein